MEKFEILLQHRGRWIVSFTQLFSFFFLKKKKIAYIDTFFLFLFSSKLTLFLPFRLNPYTDGFSWARKDGYEKHKGVHKGDELTDEDDDDL